LDLPDIISVHLSTFFVVGSPVVSFTHPQTFSFLPMLGLTVNLFSGAQNAYVRRAFHKLMISSEYHQVFKFVLLYYEHELAHNDEHEMMMG
jgi:hypothetical protein